jgi:glucose/arabinose dehydrogenase
VVVNDQLPSDGHHGWKFIRFGPYDRLYVPVGAPCDTCEPNPDRYAVIMRLHPDGSGLETFARGIRNTVGFDWPSCYQRAMVHRQRPRLVGR